MVKVAVEVVEDGVEEAWHVLEAEEDDCLVIEEENAESVERPRRVDQLTTAKTHENAPQVHTP